MPDTVDTPPAATPPAGTSAGGDAGPKVDPNGDALGDAGKAALDAERKAKKEAEAQLKAVQAELKSLQDKGKSESDLLQERLAKMETDLGAERTERLRSAAALKHGISPEDLIFLTGTDEDSIEAQATRLAARLKSAPGTKAPVPGQGTPKKTTSTGREQGLAEAERRFGKKAVS